MVETMRKPAPLPRPRRRVSTKMPIPPNTEINASNGRKQKEDRRQDARFAELGLIDAFGVGFRGACRAPVASADSGRRSPPTAVRTTSLLLRSG